MVSTGLIVVPSLILIFAALMDASNNTQNWAVGSGMMLALVGAAIVLAVAMSAHFLTAGLEWVGIMAMFKWVFFIGVWGLLSAIGAGGIVSIPMVGWVFYFVLSALFAIGIVSQVGGTAAGE